MLFLDEIILLIDESIDDSPSISGSNNSIIKNGYDVLIDEYREILNGSHKWISNYQDELQNKYKAKNIKIKYTNALGYFIEFPRSFDIASIVDLEHKQTLSGVHRYTSKKLYEFEVKIQNAEQSIYIREQELLYKINDNVKLHYDNIINISSQISFLDFLCSGAHSSHISNFVRPKFSKKDSINIVGGKHPVVAIGESDFVSNDAVFSQKDRIQIVTGPNMGGKSTYLRQNALILICAHMGYDVPAKSVELRIVDKIFSRVGASDNIILGQSTFMVEMQEIAYILRAASKNSFVIIDEIGRGTSTADGLALAWAILKFIHDTLGCTGIFATHYHELIDLSHSLDAAKNFSVAVGENNENIVFLRKLIPGGIKKSYGIEVAGLAGVNTQVIDIARKFQSSTLSMSPQQIPLVISEADQNDTVSSKERKVLTNIRELDLHALSPLELMNKVFDFKEQLKKGE